jgi:hypothetical protein
VKTGKHRSRVSHPRALWSGGGAIFNEENAMHKTFKVIIDGEEIEVEYWEDEDQSLDPPEPIIGAEFRMRHSSIDGDIIWPDEIDA